MNVAIVYNVFAGKWKGTDQEFLAEKGVEEEASDVFAALKEKAISAQLFPVSEDNILATLEGIKKAGWDLVFNLCEGLRGNSYYELHCAALIELIGIPHTGGRAIALGLFRNKVLTKQLLMAQGLPTPDYFVMNPFDKNLPVNSQFPKIVKPAEEDASLGIDGQSVVQNKQHLLAQAEKVWKVYRCPALVEDYIDGREINVALLKEGNSYRCLPPSEIIFTDQGEAGPRICGYQEKWEEDSRAYLATPPQCPAQLATDIVQMLHQMANSAVSIMDGMDYARVDFRLSKDGQPFILEVNPNPDISRKAGLARAASAAGINYPDLIERVAKNAC